MDQVSSLARAARVQLSPILANSGNILYSAAETLRPGPVYLLGLNPGGDPKAREERTIEAALASLPTKRTNAFLDEMWAGHVAGESVLQRRIRVLLEGLGLAVRDVCASNLIFQRSVSAEDLQFRSLAALCWPVHERIIEIVRPKVIITFGNGPKSPYSFVRDSLGATKQEAFPSGHGTWNCLLSFSDRAAVVGVPHLSRYAIRSEVITWIRHYVTI